MLIDTMEARRSLIEVLDEFEGLKPQFKEAVVSRFTRKVETPSVVAEAGTGRPYDDNCS